MSFQLLQCVWADKEEEADENEEETDDFQVFLQFFLKNI